MLKDQYFYPLAALLTAVMIIFALSFGENSKLTEKEILENGYVMEGADLALLAQQPGTQAIFIAPIRAEPAYAQLTSTAARDNLPPGPGVFAPLGPEYERVFATRRLKMTITARASRVSPLAKFDMGYFSAGSGDSGWKPRILSREWSDYIMEFRPGELNESQGLDHFSIWPGRTAEALSMDVLRMRVEVISSSK